MSATRPCRLPAGSGWQASAVGSSAETAARGALTGVAELAPLPGIAKTGPPPATVAVEAKIRSLLAPPTVIAEGDVPGESMVLGSGPSFPATTATITPNAEALS